VRWNVVQRAWALGLDALDRVRIARTGGAPCGGPELRECGDVALVGRVQPVLVCLQQSDELRRPRRIRSRGRSPWRTGRRAFTGPAVCVYRAHEPDLGAIRQGSG